MTRRALMISLLWGLLFSSLAWAGIPAAAVAGGFPLFSEPVVPQARSEALGSRLAGVDPGSLAGRDELILNLLPDVSLSVVRTAFKDRGQGGFTWSGRPLGQDQGLVVLSVVRGNLAGAVFSSEGSFIISPQSPGICRISREESADGSRSCQAFLSPQEIQALALEESAEGPVDFEDSGELIDIMILYTPEAAAASGDIAAEIQLAVDTTNQVYEASGVTTRLRLVHTEQVNLPIAEGSDLYPELKQLQSPDDAVIDHIHALRDTYGADIVSVFIVGDKLVNRGLGYPLTDEWHGFDPLKFAKYAFCLCVIPSASSALVLAHELGHIQGLFHDRYATFLIHGADYDKRPYVSYGWGYSLLDICSRTVMAYENQGKDTGCQASVKLPYFSNPDLVYEGHLLGVPEGDPEEAFAAKAINETAPIVANFRATVVPVAP